MIVYIYTNLYEKVFLFSFKNKLLIKNLRNNEYKFQEEIYIIKSFDTLDRQKQKKNILFSIPS